MLIQKQAAGHPSLVGEPSSECAHVEYYYYYYYRPVDLVRVAS
jgi:hypothetical protein